jgi:hypothetical protein
MALSFFKKTVPAAGGATHPAPAALPHAGVHAAAAANTSRRPAAESQTASQGQAKGAASARPADGGTNACREAARERDEKVFYVTKRHPVTAKMLTWLRLFPNVRKARKRLKKLCDKGRMKVVSMVMLPGHIGHPEFLYHRYHLAANKGQHEAEVSDIVLRISATDIRRLYDVCALQPDAEIVIGDDTYYFELDRDTHNHKDSRERLAVFRDCPNPVLWVAPSEARVKELMRMAKVEGVDKVCWFATYDQARRPHEPVWRSVDNLTIALPRAQGGA